MNRQQMQFFIIDDDPSFGRTLKRSLDRHGHAAYYFGSAQSFIDSVPSGQKGIAIVDIHMPENDGLSLMRLMRDLNYRMPVILITGHAQADTRELALQRGAIGFLQKPFNGRSLLDLIESAERKTKRK